MVLEHTSLILFSSPCKWNRTSRFKLSTIILHLLNCKELYFLICLSYWNYCKTYCFNPNDYTKLLSAVLVALSLSLQDTEMCKLKLVSKYLSIIQEKHPSVKADFSMVSEKLSNWKVSSLLPLFKCCLPGSEKCCSEFITGHREMSSGKRLHATISRFWDDSPSLWGVSAWLVFPWLTSTQCRQWGRMYLQGLPCFWLPVRQGPGGSCLQAPAPPFTFGSRVPLNHSGGKPGDLMCVKQRPENSEVQKEEPVPWKMTG